MALKRLIDVGVAFPIKPARLGAAPPASDVLDNVGAAEGSEGGVGGPEGGTGARNGSTEAKRAVSAAAPGVTPAGEPERTGEGHTARARAAVEYVPGRSAAASTPAGGAGPQRERGMGTGWPRSCRRAAASGSSSWRSRTDCASGRC